MLTFDFNFAQMRRQLVIRSAATLAGLALLAFAWYLLELRIGGTSWVRVLGLIPILVLAPVQFESTRWVGVLLGGLRRRGAALVINHAGVVDNASEYVLGQIAWAEIEKMHAGVSATPLLTYWWRMPTVDRQRGVVVILKDGVDFHSRTGARARFVKSALNIRFGRDRKRWLFVPEMLLTTTAEDVIRRLNEFYITQMTEPGGAASVPMLG